MLVHGIISDPIPHPIHTVVAWSRTRVNDPSWKTAFVAEYSSGIQAMFSFGGFPPMSMYVNSSSNVFSR